MAEAGTGILEGGSEHVLSPDPEQRGRPRTRMRALAADTGVAMTMGIIATDPGGYEMLDLIDSVAAVGGRMIGQSHCRGINVLLSFATRLPFDLLPEWHDVRALPDQEQLRALRDPSVRERLIRSGMEGDYSRWRGIGAMPRTPDFDGIRVYLRGLPPNPTINEVAMARGVTPVEAMIDLALETDLAGVVHPAQPLPAGPRRAARGDAPPPHGDDVLRLGGAPQPDRRRLDPHAPARLLGTRPAGVHARGSRPHAHARARDGLGVRRPRAAAGRDGGRRQRVRSRRASGPRSPRWCATCPAAASACRSVPRDSWPRWWAARSPSSTGRRPAPRPDASCGAADPFLRQFRARSTAQ